MKVGVSTYSFRQAVLDGRLDQYQVIDEAAKMGFETLDFSVLELAGESMEKAAPKLGKRCREAGLDAANYAVGADFLVNGVDAEVERLKRELDYAAELGAKTFRNDGSSGFPKEHTGKKSFAYALPILAEGYRRVTEYAKTLGIRTTIENHGYFAQDSERIEKLVLAVDHENFGVLVDMGNFMCADEDPVAAVSRLAPYAFHVHAKDFFHKPYSAQPPGMGWFNTRAGAWLRGTIVGHGDVPVAQCIQLVKKAGYDGPVAIEFEGIEDCLKALEDGRNNLKAIIG